MALANPVCFPNFNPYLCGVELQKKDIRKLSLPELEEFFLEQGEKSSEPSKYTNGFGVSR